MNAAERVEGAPLSADTSVECSSPTERPRFTGRLLKGAAVADELGIDVTVDELRAVNLRGAPLRFEHSAFTGQVGEIVDSYVDKDGWLWISGELYSESERPYAELPGWLRQKLRSGELSSLSISHEYEHNPATRRRVGPRVFREASLVARGKYEGTHIVAVQASGSSSSHTQTERIIVQLSRASSRAAPPPTPKLASPMASAQDGASTSTAAMTNGRTKQQIADQAALAGVAFTTQELQGRDEFGLMSLFADKLQQRQAGADAMIAEATEIKKRDTERKRAEMAPRLEMVKKLAEQAGIKDQKGFKLLEELYDMDEGEPVALIMTAVAGEAENAKAKIAEGQAELAKMKEERSALDAQLTEFRARENLQSQRKRMPDGTYAHQKQQLPTHMATGGAATAATTTSSSAESTETVETEASNADGTHKRHQDGLSAFRQRVRGDMGRLFSHIPSGLASVLQSTTSHTVLTQASNRIGSASGGISAFERKLFARAKRLENDNANGDEMM